MRRLVVFASAVFVFAGAAPAFADTDSASSPQRVTYRPPVDAPIVDPFRAPADRYAAGNRGVDYATEPGTPVGAAADGVVVFAGQVGGALHVVVLHADGIRTSYSFLQSVLVHRGDQVRQGQPVGTSADTFHFGARAGDAYLDPTLLFSDGEPHVYLVPDEVKRPKSEEDEGHDLFDSIKDLAAPVVLGPLANEWVREGAADIATKAADTTVAVAERNVEFTVDQIQRAIHYSELINPAVHTARLAKATAEWLKQRNSCTPASVPAPRHDDRHIAILVGGLGSSSGNAAVDHVDTTSLGYSPGDVKRFSYLGGTTDENSYEPADTLVDIRHSARALRDLLASEASANPGVPIDIIAHSQGGLVARAALADEVDSAAPDLPPIDSLVTLGTPHQGADLATLAHILDGTAAGRGVIDAASALGAPVKGTSVEQLSEGSEFLDRLNDKPLPAGLKATSIGGRGDLIVPAPRTRLDGARNVIVDPGGVVDQHSRIPGSPAATREIALGQAGMAPTCQDLGDMLADAAVSDGITTLEDGLGGAAWVATGQTFNPIPEGSHP